MKRLLTTLVILTGLVACDDADERFDVGYSDGVAVGYNTACQIRATLVEGDFDNVDYEIVLIMNEDIKYPVVYVVILDILKQT